MEDSAARKHQIVSLSYRAIAVKGHPCQSLGLCMDAPHLPLLSLFPYPPHPKPYALHLLSLTPLKLQGSSIPILTRRRVDGGTSTLIFRWGSGLYMRTLEDWREYMPVCKGMVEAERVHVSVKNGVGGVGGRRGEEGVDWGKSASHTCKLHR